MINNKVKVPTINKKNFYINDIEILPVNYWWETIKSNSYEEHLFFKAYWKRALLESYFKWFLNYFKKDNTKIVFLNQKINQYFQNEKNDYKKYPYDTKKNIAHIGEDIFNLNSLDKKIYNFVNDSEIKDNYNLKSVIWEDKELLDETKIINHYLINQKLLKENLKEDLKNKNVWETSNLYIWTWWLEINSTKDIKKSKIIELFKNKNENSTDKKLTEKQLNITSRWEYTLLRLKDIKIWNKIIVANSQKEIFWIWVVIKEIFIDEKNQTEWDVFNLENEYNDKKVFAIEVKWEIKQKGFINLWWEINDEDYDKENEDKINFRWTVINVSKRFKEYEKMIKNSMNKNDTTYTIQELHEKVDEFRKNNSTELYDDIKNYFQNIFDDKKIDSLKLEEYTDTKNINTFTYIIENLLSDFWNIKWWWTSIKFWIYKIGSEAKSYENDWTYAWKSSLWNNKEEVFKEVKKTILNIKKLIEDENLEEINKITLLSPMYKWKIAYLYDNNNLILPIFSEKLIKEICEKSNVEYKNYSTVYNELNQLNEEKKHIYHFSNELLEWYNEKDIEKKVEEEILNEEEKDQIKTEKSIIEQLWYILDEKKQIYKLKNWKIEANIETNLKIILENTREKDKYSFDDLDTLNIMTSLKVKPFVILTWISWVWKSLRVKQIAKAIYGNNYEIFYKHIAVKPNWTDNTALFWYYNPLTKEYVNGELNEFINKALLNPDKPFFVLLDEINLARVEYYMSDILSHMGDFDDEGFTKFIPLYEIDKSDLINSNEEEKLEKLMNTDNLIKDDLIIKNNLESKQKILYSIKENNYLLRERWNKYEVWYILSKNVFFVGTANIDETTHGFSNKVLDRCSVIEIENDYGVEVKNDYGIEWGFDLVINFSDYNIKLNSFLYKKIIDITYIDKDEEENIIKILKYLNNTEYKNKIEKYILELLDKEDEEYIKKWLILANIISNEEIIFKIISLNKKIKKLNIKSEIFSLLSKEKNEENNLIEYIKNILLKNEVKTEEENYFLVSTLWLFPQFKDDLLDYIYTNDDDVKIKVIKILKNYNSEIYFRELFDNIDNSNNLNLKLLSINALIWTDKEKEAIKKLKELIFSRKWDIDISILKSDLIELINYLKNNFDFIEDILSIIPGLDFNEQAYIIGFIFELIWDNDKIQEYLIDIFERKDDFEEEQLIPLSYYLKDIENEEIINQLIKYLDDKNFINKWLRGLRWTKNIKAINKIYDIYKNNKNDDEKLNLCRSILLWTKYNSEIINDIKNNIHNINKNDIKLFLNINNKLLNIYIFREIIKEKNINLELAESLIWNIVLKNNEEIIFLKKDFIDINDTLWLYSHRVVWDIQKYISEFLWDEKTALDYSLKQKILPKIKWYSEDLKENIEELYKKIKPYERSVKKLEKMAWIKDNKILKDYITFWK